MYLLFDVGGTKTRLAVTESKTKFFEPIVFKTPQKYPDFLKVFSENFNKLTKEKIDSSCGGLPGIIDKRGQKMLWGPNVQDFVDQNIKKDLEKIINAPLYLENDAHLAGLGEASFGAGCGFGKVAYYTISTGVGGALIDNKQIQKGVFSSEPGWQNIYGFGQLSDHGNKYDALVRFISGRAFFRRYGKKPEDVTDPKIWQEVTELLAQGLHNSIVHWLPEIIVLGGGMMKSLNCDNITENLKKISRIYPELPVIKEAELGDFGGLYGAMYLTFNK